MKTDNNSDKFGMNCSFQMKSADWWQRINKSFNNSLNDSFEINSFELGNRSEIFEKKMITPFYKNALREFYQWEISLN